MNVERPITSLSARKFPEGLFIPQTEERGKISELMLLAVGAYFDWSKDVNVFFDLIGIIEGIRVVERRNFPEDYKTHYNCARYVFGIVMEEPWCHDSGESIPPALWEKTAEFLEDNGYRLENEPERDDIVVYLKRMIENGQTKIRATHFGIYQDGRVVSKFAHGHIFRHPIELVPASYGDEAMFFRKNKIF